MRPRATTPAGEGRGGRGRTRHSALTTLCVVLPFAAALPPSEAGAQNGREQALARCEGRADHSINRCLIACRAGDQDTAEAMCDSAFARADAWNF